MQICYSTDNMIISIAGVSPVWRLSQPGNPRRHLPEHVTNLVPCKLPSRRIISGFYALHLVNLSRQEQSRQSNEGGRRR